MIRCLIFSVTEGRHEYGWKFETRIPDHNPTTLYSGFERGERNYPPGVLCCLWLPSQARHSVVESTEKGAGETTGPQEHAQGTSKRQTDIVLLGYLIYIFTIELNYPKSEAKCSNLSLVPRTIRISPSSIVVSPEGLNIN